MVPCVGGLARRIVFAPVVFLAVAVVMYGGLRILRPDLYPGDPLVSGIVRDLGSTLRLEFGCAPGCTPLRELWREGMAADLWLVAGAIVVGVAGGILAGLWCVGHPRSLRARVLHAVATFTYCAPVYFVALALLYLFNPVFGRFHVPFFFDAVPRWTSPFTDPWMWLRSFLVPWFVLAAPLAGMCLRLTAAAGREVVQEDYVRTAMAKGLPPRDVLRRHVGPPTFGSTVAFVGASVPLFILNIVLVERVFSVPGFFHDLWEAMGHNDESAIDLGTVSAVAQWATVFVIVLGILSDAVLARLDPRVRYSAF